MNKHTKYTTCITHYVIVCGGGFHKINECRSSMNDYTKYFVLYVHNYCNKLLTQRLKAFNYANSCSDLY